MVAPILDLSQLNGKNGFRINGLAEGDSLGYSVSSAGDINGDGIDDLIIGAHGVLTFPSYDISSGRSYVVFGSRKGFAADLNLSKLTGSNGFRITGITEMDYLGRSVSGAGDVNGDGIDDLIIGADGADPQGSNSGQSYVVFGNRSGFAADLNPSTLNGNNGFRINGIAAGNHSGRSVSGAGDVNGDGIDDLIIGSDGESYVVFGSRSGFAADLNLSTLNDNNGFRINGIAPEDSLNSVSNAGDVNGDGIDDLIIGSETASPQGNLSGQSYVVFGSHIGFAADLNLSKLNGKNGFRINGTADDGLGGSVSNAGDVNGDGLADLIIGSASASPHGMSSGQSYVVFGSRKGFAADLNLSKLNGKNGFRITGIAAGDSSGRAVSGAGDVNGDGIDDLIIGADGADPHRSDSGQSYVVFGSRRGFAANLNLSTLNGKNGFRINGITLRDHSGRSVSSAGDVNGDGIDDLIIGADRADTHGTDAGQSYVVFGVAGAIAGLTLTASTVNAIGVTGSINADLTTGKLILNFTPRPVSRSIAGYTNVIGTAFNDTLIGSNKANTLTGNKGNDTLVGNDGNDGNDVLTGGGGNDSLHGGSGNDRFLFSFGKRFKGRQIGIDTVVDFTHAQDKLVIDRATFNSLKKISFASVKNLAQARQSTAQLAYIRESGALYFNANGSKSGFGIGGEFADLANTANLTAKDIVLGST